MEYLEGENDPNMEGDDLKVGTRWGICGEGEEG